MVSHDTIDRRSYLGNVPEQTIVSAWLPAYVGLRSSDITVS